MSKKVENTEVAVVNETTAVSTETQSGIGRGFEGTDLSSVAMPRVKVMQGLSPELEDPDYNFRQGDIIHGLMMEKMPEKFTPISIFDNRIMFAPRAEGGEILCRSLDGKEGSIHGKCADCISSKWTDENGNPDPTGEVPPKCTQTINALALFEGHDMPIVIPFSNTSYKFGRKFRDLALFSGGDVFARKYKLTSVKQTNAKGTFYVFNVKPVGRTEGDELLRAEAMYKRFGKVLIDVEADNEDHGDATNSTEY